MAGSMLGMRCCRALVSHCSSTRQKSLIESQTKFIKLNHAAWNALHALPLVQSYSTTSPTAVNPGNQNGGKRKSSGYYLPNEWKILGTAAVAAITWYVNAQQDRKEVRRDIQLTRITNQLKELYGPLYGNRIVTEASYRAAMRDHGGLRKYLQTAQDTRDGEMIKVWRAYVVNVLYPLDKQALELIVERAHLIADTDFPEEFEKLMAHTAKMQFLMEHWKNNKGKLESVEEFNDLDYLEETNSSGMGGSKKIIEHLREKCRTLRDKQLKYTEDLNVEDLHVRIINKIMK